MHSQEGNGQPEALAAFVAAVSCSHRDSEGSWLPLNPNLVQMLTRDSSFHVHFHMWTLENLTEQADSGVYRTDVSALCRGETGREEGGRCPEPLQAEESSTAAPKLTASHSWG